MIRLRMLALAAAVTAAMSLAPCAAYADSPSPVVGLVIDGILLLIAALILLVILAVTVFVRRRVARKREAHEAVPPIEPLAEQPDSAGEKDLQ